MLPKNNSIFLLNDNIKNNLDFESVIIKKIEIFKEIIQKSLLYIQKNKFYEILGVNELIFCIDKLMELTNKLNEIKIMDKNNEEFIISTLQYINNELSLFFKNYGTENLNDLFIICFGNNLILKNDNKNKKYKIELLLKYFHPTGYKILNKKEIIKNKFKNLNINVEKEINEKTENFDCFDADISFKTFHLKVYGIKLFIQHEKSNKIFIIYGFTDPVLLPILNNPFINEIQKTVLLNIPKNTDFDRESFQLFLESLFLKDYFMI
jgi:hypothetical protein